jgi:CheY-like chemotaxis protein
MDLLMPDFSGIEVVRRIRTECAAPHCHVKVVALTANVSEDALNQCKEVGIDILIPKPFDRVMLIQTVLQHTA